MTRTQLIKVKSLVLYGSGQLMPAVSGVVLSFVVMKTEPLWWGYFNSLQVYFMIAVVFMAWGNKDYLMRKFSAHPAMMHQVFAEQLISRIPLLFVAMLPALFIPFTINEVYTLGFCLLAAFLSQSAEALFWYHRQFVTVFYVEWVCLLTNVLLFLVISQNGWGYASLLISFSVALFLKAVIYVHYFKRYYFSVFPSRNVKLIIASAPFAFMAFSGTLFSRSMLIAAGQYMNALTLAQYRVVFLLLLLVQSTGAFIFQPFLPVYYRANQLTARKMTHKVMLWGLLICLAAAILLPVITYYGFSFHLSLTDCIFSAVFVAAAHFALPAAYKMIKYGQVIRITVYSFLGTLFLFIAFHICFQQQWPPITAGLAASAFSQVIVLILFLSSESIQPQNA